MAAKRYVFFGDSLTDPGNIFALTDDDPLLNALGLPGVPIEAAGYVDGVFSNGPVYSQILPDLLGLGDDQVLNFARGGAVAADGFTVGDLLSGASSEFDDLVAGAIALDPSLAGPAAALLGAELSLSAQVDAFLATPSAPEPEHLSASILIGLNDFGNLTPDGALDAAIDGVATLIDVVDETFEAANRLIDQGGVDELIFYTFPDASFFPSPPDAPPADPLEIVAADALFAAHEAAIRTGAAALELFHDVETHVVDLGALTDEVRDDPETFGFLAVGPTIFAQAVPSSPTPPFFETSDDPALLALDPDQSVFFDLVHPTTGLHGVIAAFTEATLDKRERFLDDGRDFVLGIGEDFVFAEGGDDRLFLGRNDDIGFGGRGRDDVYGGRGDDILSGGGDDDMLNGGRGHDLLAGGLGDDAIEGGRGRDLLIGGLGDDTLKGGRNDDLFLFVDPELLGDASRSDFNRFHGGSGTDALVIAIEDAALRAEVNDAFALGVDNGVYAFDTFEFELSSIESVTVVESRQALADVATASAEFGRDADLWGLV